ncbi:hypothetical protein HRI_004448500 [Hibiscus trionum]|uniref:Uncharacterized protein n=1 Tax=Hibiscus trionum TaxID=183268 RepID=A0A9W7MK82_HIBTR|nr:hypothetical protein HRI_004448500 [Hibiscus trionum]
MRISRSNYICELGGTESTLPAFFLFNFRFTLFRGVGQRRKDYIDRKRFSLGRLLFLNSTFFSRSSQLGPLLSIYVIECHPASARIEANTWTLK